MFQRIARDINDQGYSIQKNALPTNLGSGLWDQLHNTPSSQFQKAGIGRNDGITQDPSVRTDRTSWIDNNAKAGRAWNDWMVSLQVFLNARLFLGLFSFESHFACYHAGGFYQRHQDAFVGEGNRILSVVVYLNRDWVAKDAGELALFTGKEHALVQHVAPKFGTMVIFLSDEFPHEVLKTNRDRHSIAGWFHGNGSNANRANPPL